METHTADRSWRIAGAAALLLAVPISWLVFLAVAAMTCHSDGCYGDNPVPPLVVSGFVVFLLMRIGVVALDHGLPAPDRYLVHRRIGIAFMILAVPAGILAASIVAGRYCEAGCGGDYMVMAFLGYFIGLGLAIVLLVAGAVMIIAATRARRASRNRQAEESSVRP